MKGEIRVKNISLDGFESKINRTSYVNSRELIESLMNNWKPDMQFQELLDLIQELPRTEIDDWVPCDEKMPNKEDYYMVTKPSGLVAKEFYSETYKSFVSTVPPIAWMPVPNGYVMKG